MLRPLTLLFNVAGSGIRTLRNIRDSYRELLNRFRDGNNFISRIFRNLSNVFGGVSNRLSRAILRIGGSFIRMRARAETALNALNGKGNTLIGTFTRLAGILGGGMVIRNAFEGATTLEMQRTAIASMRGQARADELMKYGVNFANITPYQTSEVLDAIKKLELRGLDPTKYLEGIGNMSAMLGKPLDQAVEAMLDAVTGEFERLTFSLAA